MPVLLAAVLFLAGADVAAARSAPALVPRPAVVRARAGRLVLGPDSVVVTDPAAEVEARRLAAALAPAPGFALEVVVAPRLAPVRRRLHLCGRTPRDPRRCSRWIHLGRARHAMVAEAYELDVFPGMARLRASDAAGWFYAGQTLRQLLPPAIFSPTPSATRWVAPAVRIVDRPRFAWRGAMLDSGRHFFPKEVVKKLIDLLALHKLNRFHWHLTDDQGWRIEIRRYPRLTGVGSQRAESPVRFLPHGGFLNFFLNSILSDGPTVFDGVPHGGFYTQDDVREIVAYAADRHVEVVPEIDMPGHVSAAIAAHPELGNTGTPIPVATDWGIQADILNVDEPTILFMQDVLAEVLELFPGPFVHVGGDEVYVAQWVESPAAQARMAELSLTDVNQLATFVSNRMGAFLAEHGRRWIAWNEALRDGLAADAAIMSWIGQGPGVAAARAGRDVVMAPLERTYLDYPNALPLPPDEQALLAASAGDPSRLAFFVTTLEEAYGFEPVPDELTDEEAAHVLGGQGQLWTEWLDDGRDLEATGFPRLCALAEAVWTPAARRDYADFTRRLARHLPRLEALDVCYFGATAPACTARTEAR